MRQLVSTAFEVETGEVQLFLERGALYLDVRTEQEFELGHVPTAYNVPLDNGSTSGLAPNLEFERVVLANFPKHQRLVVGCHSGGRAARAIARLRELSFENLLWHRSGWDGARDAFGRKSQGWSSSGCAIETGAPAGRSYAALRCQVKPDEHRARIGNQR